MGAYFRAIGDEFDVDAFLAGSVLDPDQVFHRGEPGSIIRSKPCEATGFAIQISRGFGRLQDHIEEVLSFLREHELELGRLSRYEGVTELSLDFGYERCPEAVIQCDYLPAELVALAGSLGVGIELSLYPASDRTVSS